MKAIELKGYTKILKRKYILDEVSLDVEEGETVWITGPNGSGKTMLLRAVSGVIRPSRGSVRIFGKELNIRYPSTDSVGVVIEDTEFWKQMTGLETLKCLASIQKRVDENDIHETLLRVGLDPKDKRKVEKYSLGMKKRLAIAQAVMESPRLLLFDEPTNALDKDGIRMFRNLISKEKEKGTTILIASHVDEDMEGMYDRIVELRDGKIVLRVDGKEKLL